PRAHCSASAASRWALHLSLVGALAGAGAACDKSGKARAPRGEETPSEDAPASTEKTDVGTPSGEGPESREDDPQGVESPDPRPAEPQRTLYGGPRMGAVDPAVDRGDTIDEPAVV